VQNSYRINGEIHLAGDHVPNVKAIKTSGQKQKPGFIRQDKKISLRENF
jgi:hypothetical protein